MKDKNKIKKKVNLILPDFDCEQAGLIPPCELTEIEVPDIVARLSDDKKTLKWEISGLVYSMDVKNAKKFARQVLGMLGSDNITIERYDFEDIGNMIGLMYEHFKGIGIRSDILENGFKFLTGKIEKY